MNEYSKTFNTKSDGINTNGRKITEKSFFFTDFQLFLDP